MVKNPSLLVMEVVKNQSHLVKDTEVRNQSLLTEGKNQSPLVMDMDTVMVRSPWRSQLASLGSNQWNLQATGRLLLRLVPCQHQRDQMRGPQRSV